MEETEISELCDAQSDTLTNRPTDRLIAKLQCKQKSVWRQFGTLTHTAHNHTPLIVFRNLDSHRCRCTHTVLVHSLAAHQTIDIEPNPPTRALTQILNFTIFYRQKIEQISRNLSSQAFFFARQFE